MGQETTILQKAINILERKHKDYEDEIQALTHRHSADQSDIKRVAAELEESMAELEESRRKIVNLKMQMNGLYGMHLPALNPVNGSMSPEKPLDRSMGIRELKTSLEEAKTLAATRLSELQKAQVDTLVLSKKLQEIQDELKDEKFVFSSRPYALLSDRAQHWNAEVERYKELTDSLQVIFHVFIFGFFTWIMVFWRQSTKEDSLNLSAEKRTMPFQVFFKDASLVFKKDELGLEILRIAYPAALALTADPIASLIDTAFIGHIGPVELAAVGVSIAVFNQISRITIFPLVSVTTSFVAEEDTASRIIDVDESDSLEKALPENSEMKELIRSPGSGKDVKQFLISRKEDPNIENVNEKRSISSASSALVIGAMLGLFQAVFLIFAAKPLLSIMGVKTDSPMLTPAVQYLRLRSLGAPAILLSLAMQGIFRGFKDTKTPLYATVVGDVINIILDPIFIFVFKWGAYGAAIAHIVSQYLASMVLIFNLTKKINLLPPSIGDIQFARFLKNGSMLLARVIAVTFCVTLAASMAARLGPIPMAAFQISLQIWLETSLLADGLAVAGQAILASSFAESDHEKATSTTARVLQHGLVLGLVLSLVLGVGLKFGSRLFTKDIHVLQLISLSIPFVAATQPINSLAFVFDGINFGASDFAYAAYSMLESSQTEPVIFVSIRNKHI